MVRKAKVLPRLAAVGGVLAGTAAASLVASPAGAEGLPQAPASCEVHELPLPPGVSGGSVTGSSPDGRTLLGSTSRNGGPAETVVIWRDGQIVDTIEDAPNTLSDINSNGVAVGGHFDEYSDARPWVYDNGQIRVLPGDVSPTAINDSGQIVGYDANGAVTWEPGSDEPVPLEGGAAGSAHDIAADGTIVGTAPGEGGTDAVSWQDGALRVLPRPEGSKPQDHLTAAEINGPWVIGSGPGGTVRWNIETGAAENIPDVYGDDGGINEHGWLVGTQRAGDRAVLVADGRTIELPPYKSYPIHAARTVSSDGSVIGGSAVIPKGDSQPVYWSCA
ncbi:hypothetical protein [Saccharopolyspora gloriosae]|uniref:hypothetical protein n=1 Tax=Saccharopolyspora gloriosae TaxID=455344 RepID=UPI001FB6A427|nr:hypothetical protein [Saccharopolyspora gloriosae]